MSFNRFFTAAANKVAYAAGHPATFASCVAVIVIWAVSGPIFHFSDTWQLIINTGTTIVTFLMVFLIQNTQNRDGAAIQAKLDELIRASDAQNVFIGIEHLTEQEVEEFRTKCERAASELEAHKGLKNEKTRTQVKKQAERLLRSKAKSTVPAKTAPGKKVAEKVK